MATTILMNPMSISIYANEITQDVSTEDTNNVETNPVTNDTNEITNNPTEKDKVLVPEEIPENQKFHQKMKKLHMEIDIDLKLVTLIINMGICTIIYLQEKISIQIGTSL
ncbi:hypothetical protein [Paraclostridium sp. AKS73]|uniref:hypothetical protein n=1 Tax=Paraclostridium sp. AKS73 TaxID=2876116 RepID=UPI0021DF874F|nr:hypothetical protein [Paraclostridium sp. AKS73]MCU9816703.1 hypothetical protein [Paraclostridium sp. AKS73]